MLARATDQAFALFTDAACLRDRGIAQGAEGAEVTVAGTETAVSLGRPTAVLPPAVARVVASAVLPWKTSRGTATTSQP